MVQKHHNLKTDKVADFFFFFFKKQTIKRKEKKKEEKSDFITENTEDMQWDTALEDTRESLFHTHPL